MQLETYIGAKRDDVHDGGTKYTKIAKREDYLSKATIIENGGLLFPTLSDKSTWFYLTGITLPGLQYDNGQVYGDKPRFGRGGRIVFSTSDDIGNYASNPLLDQFLEYAECERAAVVKDLLLKKIPFRKAIIVDAAGVATTYAGDGGIVVTC